MKRITFALGMTFIVLSVFLSCTSNSDKNASAESKSDTKQIEESYMPGPEWQLAWADEFEAASLDEDNWNFQVVEAGRFNEEWQRYTNSSENAYIEDECLVIKAIHESDEHGMDQYTSARLNTANKQSWKYGRIAASIKLPHGKGIWPAFWMLGANIIENGGDTPWPKSGEIDILELYGSKDDAAIEVNAHYADSSGSHAMMGAVHFKLDEGIFADDFHIFELDWDADRLKWFVDGNEIATVPIIKDEFAEFHEEFFILLNIAVGGTYAGRPDASSPMPQYMYIDWVRVYEKIK